MDTSIEMHIKRFLQAQKYIKNLPSISNEICFCHRTISTIFTTCDIIFLQPFFCYAIPSFITEKYMSFYSMKIRREMQGEKLKIERLQGVPTSLEQVKSNVLILRSLRAKQPTFRKNRILLQEIAYSASFVNCKIENGIFQQLCSICLMQ